jgi:hypothetical protein
MSVRKLHLLAQGGVLALLQSSEYANYACGCKKVRALPGSKIYHFRTNMVLETIKT